MDVCAKFEKLWVISSLALAIGLGGCSQTAQTTQSDVASTVENGDLPQVVATTSVLCDLTQQIAQDTIALTCLMAPGQDPHTYEAIPSDRRAIAEADLILYGGYDSAPEIIQLVEASHHQIPKIAVYETAVPDPLVGEAHDHDHAHGADLTEAHSEAAHAEIHGEDIHAEHEDEAPVSDPHIWHSASNNAAMVDQIAANLEQINPEQADRYRQRTAQIAAQFADLDTWIETQVATIPIEHRKLVTIHNAFQYFTDAYGFEVVVALTGLSTEEKPSAGRLTQLVEQVKAAKAPAIFAETSTNLQLIKTVANEAGVVVAERPLYVEGPGGPGSNAETMQAMLVANTCTIVNALGGVCNDVGALEGQGE